MVNFIVYGIPRVGSNYFISKLNQHPEILCHYEIFHKNEIYYGFDDKHINTDINWTVTKRDSNIDKFIESIWSHAYNKKAIGYNIFPNQNDTVLKQSTKDKEIKKIILKRKDILKNFISLKIAMKTGVWSSKDIKNKKNIKDKRVLFNRDEFVKYVHNMNKYYTNLENNIILNRDKYLVVYYEDFIENKKEILQSVFKYLEVKDIDILEDKENFKKQNSDSLEELVSNYNDLKEFLNHGHINFFMNKKSQNSPFDVDNNKLKQITTSIELLTKTSLLKYPIQKFKYYKKMINIYHQTKDNLYITNNINKQNIMELKENQYGKINLSNQLNLYGENVHRSGWNYAMSSLIQLHNADGALLNGNIDSTFSKWKQNIQIPTLSKWIGFFHFPQNIPIWHPQYNINEKIIYNTDFQQSLPYCKGVFVLSNYHKKYLETKLDIPIETLYHPTLTPTLKFSWENFEANQSKKVVQLGFFLRRLHSIYELKSEEFQKVFLKPNTPHIENLMKLELKNDVKNKNIEYSKTKVVEFLENEKYDELLSENIAFLHLYDASANNAIIECIVRNTPLLVNPLESVVEYLGEEYPFYFNTLEEASEKLSNRDLIYQTYQYLLNYPFKLKLSKEYFLESFKNSDIYKGLQ